MSQKPMYKIESIKDTYSIILKFTEDFLPQYVNNDKKQKIQPAIDYITQNYNSDIKNEMLSEMCGISTV